MAKISQVKSSLVETELDRNRQHSTETDKTDIKPKQNGQKQTDINKTERMKKWTETKRTAHKWTHTNRDKPK